MCPYLCAEEEEEEEVKEEEEEEEEEEVVVKKQVVEEEVDFAPTAAADLDMDEVRCSAPHRVSFCWYLSVFWYMLLLLKCTCS